jgi:hypothetical protein
MPTSPARACPACPADWYTQPPWAAPGVSAPFEGVTIKPPAKLEVMLNNRDSHRPLQVAPFLAVVVF